MSIEYTTEIVNHSRVIVECAFETCSCKAKWDFAWTESEPLDPQAQSWMDGQLNVRHTSIEGNVSVRVPLALAAKIGALICHVADDAPHSSP